MFFLTLSFIVVSDSMICFCNLADTILCVAWPCVIVTSYALLFV